jgi:hypothetical protein
MWFKFSWKIKKMPLPTLRCKEITIICCLGLHSKQGRNYWGVWGCDTIGPKKSQGRGLNFPRGALEMLDVLNVKPGSHWSAMFYDPLSMSNEEENAQNILCINDHQQWASPMFTINVNQALSNIFWKIKVEKAMKNLFLTPTIPKIVWKKCLGKNV